MLTQEPATEQLIELSQTPDVQNGIGMMMSALSAATTGT